MSFAHNARVMLIGFSLAQALPLLAAPLLTRLYSPEAFGIQALFLSITSTLLVLATLRLDLATVLAADRRQAMQIVSLAALQIGLSAALISASLLAFGSMIAVAMGHPGMTVWIWAIVPMIFALAVVQVSSGMLTWLRNFGPASRVQVINQVSYLLVAIGLGFWASPTEGLVMAKLAGQVIAAAVIMSILKTLWAEISIPSRADWRCLWQRCKPFLIFNTPYSLVGVLGREVPIFALSSVAATAAAGHYGLARTLLAAPAALLAASLSQVFYREAVEHRGTPRLEQLTFALLKVTTTVTAPVVAMIMIWGDFGFALFFGRDWEVAGSYAMLLAFPAWLGIQTAWPERLYESVARQDVSFAIQISFDIVTAIVVFSLVWAGLSAWFAVAVFAAINSTFHLTFLGGMIKVSGFSLASLARTLATATTVLVGCLAALLACRLLIGSNGAGFACAAAFALASNAGLVWHGYRSTGVYLRNS